MPIKVDYAALEAAQERITKISGMLDENLAELRGRLQALHWVGEDRTAYQLEQDNWDTAVTNLNTTLNNMGIEVGNAKTRFLENEMRGARRWGA